MTARESAHDRGRRLLVEGRLNIRLLTGEQIRATCRGDSAEEHRLGWTAGRGWWCACPVRTDACAHLVALRLVTVIQTTTPIRKTTSDTSRQGTAR